MKSKKSLVFLLMAIILLVNLNCLVMAEEAGTGSGQNKDTSLALESSVPQNGFDNMTVDGKIELIFNKNVVNMSVSDNNKKCFKLTDVNGKLIKIDVIMPDDQTEPNKKRNIYIKPVDSLTYSTKYVLTISSDLIAKSGSVLGNQIQLVFTTQSATQTEKTSESVQTATTDNTNDSSESTINLEQKNSGDNTNDNKTDSQSTAVVKQAAVSTQTSDKSNQQPVQNSNLPQKTDTNNFLFPVIIVAAILIIGIAIIVSYKIITKNKGPKT